MRLAAAGVEDEFRAGAATSPLALPDGYTWPATTGQEHGISAAHERGGPAASRHLEALATGYGDWDALITAQVEPFVDDPVHPPSRRRPATTSTSALRASPPPPRRSHLRSPPTTGSQRRSSRRRALSDGG